MVFKHGQIELALSRHGIKLYPSFFSRQSLQALWCFLRLVGRISISNFSWYLQDLIFFSITILHIIPELFDSGFDSAKMGLYILIGFLLQQILEFLSSGIEHGHIHLPHGPKSKGVLTVMLGLFIHAFLEGTLLSHGTLMGDTTAHIGHSHSENTLLLGIILHKGPAAFALAAVLLQVLSKRWTLILLVVFALASPLGMISSSLIFQSGILEKEWIGVLYGLVTGGFFAHFHYHIL